MKKSIAICILFISVVFCKAGWENPIFLRFTPSSPAPKELKAGAVLDVKDDKYPSVYAAGWDNGFLNKTVVNKIVFGIDINQGGKYHTTYKISAQLMIEAWDASGTAMTTIYPTLSLRYNPASGAKEDLKTVYTLTSPSVKYHRVKVTVINILDSATGTASFRDHIYVENFMQVERYYTVSPNSTEPGTSFASKVTQNGTTLSGEELEVSWNPLAPEETPEAYELEWTYSQDYLKDVGVGPEFDFIFNVNFKNNSTNVIIKNTSYKIPLVYQFGIVVWRVRAIYVDFANLNVKKYTEWSSVDVLTISRAHGSTDLKDEAANVLDNAYISSGFNENKNWQYAISFAEEGKNKVVISYYDGLLRSRQSITRVNSDENAIVGQTIYDFTGRPAIQVLPVPTVGNLSLDYREEFNNSAVSGEPNYTWKHFDVDASGDCSITKTHAMSNQYGASQYYASSSPGSYQLGGDRIPQANGYPFAQVEYTPDNTGRVRRQGGVGLQHRLTGTDENDVTKVGHETKYFYGTPNGQRELFRLFGNEIGSYEHYKKNLVIDPNGQISVTYMDPQGRVVASALAGEEANTPNLDAIATSAIEVWEEYENTEVDYNDHTLTSHRTILVEKPGEYTFYYKLAAPKFHDDCMQVEFCFDCMYDLEMSIKAMECNQELVIPENLKYMSGLLTAVNAPELDTECGDSIVLELRPDDLGATYEPLKIYLEVGRYTVSKKLTVSKKALDYYKEQYMANLSGDCDSTFDDFLNTEKAKLDYTKCTYNCVQCYTDANGDPEKKAQCDEFCKQKSECDGLLLIMKQDMSVGGQYFDNVTVTQASAGGDIDPNDASFVYDGGRTDINDWLIRRAPVSSTIETNFFTTFNTRFAPGGTPQFYNWDDIRDRWIPEFAEELVKLHPEYCLYEQCVGIQESYKYDQLLMSITDGSEALSKGYFNPIQMTMPDVDDTKYIKPSNADRDPFFFTKSGPISPRWGNMETYLLNIKNTAATTVGTAWDLIDDNQTNPGGAEMEAGSPTGCLSDYDWQFFRALYLAQKQNLYNDYYQSCDLDAAVMAGAETYNQLISGKSRRFFNGVDEAFSDKGYTTTPGTDITDMSNSFCDKQCLANAELWVEDLKECNFSTNDLNDLKNELIEICGFSCDEGSDWGASTSMAYTENGNHTFEEAISWMINKGGYKLSDICNPLSVSFPPQGVSTQKLMVPLDNCACDKVSLNHTDYQQRLSLGTLPDGVCSEAELFEDTYGVGVDDLKLLKCLCDNGLDRTDVKHYTHTVNSCHTYFGGISDCVNGVSYRGNAVNSFVKYLIDNYNFDAPTLPVITNAKTTLPTFFSPGSLIYPNSYDTCTARVFFGPKTGGVDINGNYLTRPVIISDYCGFSCTLTIKLYYGFPAIGFSDIDSIKILGAATLANEIVATAYTGGTGHSFKILSSCFTDLDCNDNLFLLPEVFVPIEIACEKCLSCEDLLSNFNEFKAKYPYMVEPQAQSQLTARFTEYLNYKMGYNFTMGDVDAAFSSCIPDIGCSNTTSAIALKALLSKMISRNDLGKTGITFDPINYPEFFNPAIYSGSPSDTPKIVNDNPYYTIFQPGNGYTYNFLTGQFSVNVTYPINVINGSPYPVVIAFTALVTTTGNTSVYIGDSLGNGGTFIVPPLTSGQTYYITTLVNPVLLSGDPNVTLLWVKNLNLDYPFGISLPITFGTSLINFNPNANAHEFTITDKNGLKCKIKFSMPDGMLTGNISSIINVFPDPYALGSSNSMKATVLMKGSTVPVEVTIYSSCHTLTSCGSLPMGVNKCPDPIDVAESNPCYDRLDALAASNAKRSYEKFLKDKLETFEKNYLAHCMQPFEKFGSTHLLQQYQITLYYYDQANNLIKTIPPKGVKTLAEASIDSAVLHKENQLTNPRIKPNHEFITHYKYNTLNQLVEQYTKDGGTSTFYYDRLGRLVLSQNAKQAVDDHYSYTRFDEQGRVIEVGEMKPGATMEASSVADDSWLTATIDNAIGSATQITKSFYDDILLPANTVPGFVQDNLRKRIATVAYYKSYVSDDLELTHATHYTYDVTGRVKQLVQDNPELNRFRERFKTIHYNYDVISGKTNMVAYQPDSLDRFYHYYQYDADNRLKTVYTSRNATWAHLQAQNLPDIPNSPDWVQDAKYDYFMHGPMVRTELGEQKVQGLDYTYTLQGWLKAINSSFGLAYADGNQDGFNVMAFAQDAFGFEIGYYNGDYAPVSSKPYPVIANQSGSSLPLLQSNLYNGNISYTVTSLPDSLAYSSNLLTQKPMASLYRYDQMNRLSRSRTLNFNAADLANDRWLSGYDTITDYYMKLSYDPNGNITYMQRNAEAGNIAMDVLTYHYDGNTNKLTYVDDNVTTTTAHSEDIDDQGTGNYVYDEIGNLIQDYAEEIETIEWTVYGKVKSITRKASSMKPDLAFTYDAMGRRVSKKVIPKNGEKPTITYYVTDTRGNMMATYILTDGEDPLTPTFFVETLSVQEFHVYGSSRLGIEKNNIVLAENSYPDVPENGTYTYYTYTAQTTYTLQLGNKYYELNNHLDNVLVTVTDRKVPVNGGGTIDYHIPDIVSVTDYYPFGMVMEKRSWSVGGYRFGFNGQEKDDELYGNGNSTTAEYWQYDSRLGRRWNMDPVKMHSTSPYVTLNNNPNWYKDKKGDFWHIVGGAVLGALKSVVSQTITNGINNVREGKGFFKGWARQMDWGDVAISAGDGAISAAFPGYKILSAGVSGLIKAGVDLKPSEGLKFVGGPGDYKKPWRSVGQDLISEGLSFGAGLYLGKVGKILGGGGDLVPWSVHIAGEAISNIVGNEIKNGWNKLWPEKPAPAGGGGGGKWPGPLLNSTTAQEIQSQAPGGTNSSNNPHSGSVVSIQIGAFDNLAGAEAVQKQYAFVGARIIYENGMWKVYYNSTNSAKAELNWIRQTVPDAWQRPTVTN